jgi:hypothetical protein
MKAIVQNEYGSPGMKYRRVVVTRHGGPEVLQVVEEELPEPEAGDVRVKVLAAGVSAYDLMHRRSGSLPACRIPRAKTSLAWRPRWQGGSHCQRLVRRVGVAQNLKQRL